MCIQSEIYAGFVERCFCSKLAGVQGPLELFQEQIHHDKIIQFLTFKVKSKLHFHTGRDTLIYHLSCFHILLHTRNQRSGAQHRLLNVILKETNRLLGGISLRSG